MKKHYLLLLLAIVLINSTFKASAQVVATDVFLQGRWLEVGVDQMAAFGTCSAPAGYHTHACCGTATCVTALQATDATYDWGHDGWTTGSPCFMGPYTIPGYPQEGWSIQIGATEYRNWAGGGVCTGSFSVPGGITGYSNAGGIITGTFTGNIGGIHIVQESRVDTLASWVVVTTKMYNTTGANIAGIYYERTCDPDNTSFWDGGSATENVIVHQNEDATHRVMVGTYSTVTAFTTPAITFNYYNSYLGLCTKDCRAKCGILTGGLFPSVTPSALWSGSSSTTALGDSSNNDVGIWLSYNIGTILAHDSAVVSYAYVYDGHGGVDSAFPDPQISIPGYDTLPNATEPYPTHDSINVCSLPPGTTTLPITMIYSGDKDWTWSHLDMGAICRLICNNRYFGACRS